MINISGFGLSAVINASNTYPNGFVLTDFADDADPLDSPDFQVADTGFALNGTMVTWSRAQGIEVGFNVIPTSEGDINLDTLLDANRVGAKKNGARDKVSIVFNYPNGDQVTCSEGIVVVGSMLPGVASAARLKSRQYRFRFERITKSRAQATA